MKIKKTSNYITGHCATGTKKGHDRCGVIALPPGMTCKCACHLLEEVEPADGSFPSGDASDGQTDASAAVVDD